MSQRVQYTQKAPKIIEIISFKGSRGSTGGIYIHIYIYTYIYIYMHIYCSYKLTLVAGTRGERLLGRVEGVLGLIWYLF